MQAGANGEGVARAVDTDAPTLWALRPHAHRAQARGGAEGVEGVGIGGGGHWCWVCWKNGRTYEGHRLYIYAP